MFAAGAVIVGGVVVLAMIRLAGWRDPESEAEFEALVQRAERLAAEDSWGDSRRRGAATTDGRRRCSIPMTTRTSGRSCAGGRRAAARVPPCARARRDRRLRRRLAGRRGAYGLYQGDTVAQDFFHDRIVIFRDTLMRDFGHDPDCSGRRSPAPCATSSPITSGGARRAFRPRPEATSLGQLRSGVLPSPPSAKRLQIRQRISLSGPNCSPAPPRRPSCRSRDRRRQSARQIGRGGQRTRCRSVRRRRAGGRLPNRDA